MRYLNYFFSYILQKEENGRFSSIKHILLKNINIISIPYKSKIWNKMQLISYNCDIIYDSGIKINLFIEKFNDNMFFIIPLYCEGDNFIVVLFLLLLLA